MARILNHTHVTFSTSQIAPKSDKRIKYLNMSWSCANTTINGNISSDLDDYY